MNAERSDRFRARKMRGLLERASVDLANWMTARITVDRHLNQVNANGSAITEEEIRDVRVREVIDGYNVGKTSDIYSPRGFRPLPYHSQDGVALRSPPLGVLPSGHGGVSRRLPPKFHPFASPAIGTRR